MYKWEAEGDAKAVIVIVHGAMEHQGRYKWLVEMWRSAGYHVIMGDLPGQGLTTRARRGHINSFDEYLIEVKDWIQEAYEYHLPIFLLGHSMGGLIAIRLIQEAEVNIAGLILSSPCLGLATYPPKAMQAASAILNFAYPKFKATTGITIDMITRDPEVRESGLNDSLYITKVSVRWYHELLTAVKEAFENIPDLGDLPILLMQAGDDKIVDKAAVREWFNFIMVNEKLFKEWQGLYHELFSEPEKEDVFYYAESFVKNRLRNLGYVVQ
ncbi:alpha/beta hydrolase [Bacillus testis]|uniref:alpha/beta hydrolase n=1 Tax=Bacillus testis TaxID=1622072 RepID=UPI00067E7936|nr:alpha/beta hydrolase [Bacillus testis]